MSKKPRPELKLFDWIAIGKVGSTAHPTIDAVVSVAKPELVEVVYMDSSGQSVNRDVVWDQDHWEFDNKSSYGGRADRYDRLSQHVALLRRGRYH